MHGGLSVESDGLRRIARQLEFATSEVRDGAGSVPGSEDAGRSTDELTSALDELHHRLQLLAEGVSSFAQGLLDVADDFDQTDDEVAGSLLRLPERSPVR
ncbi:MAG: hypothetical protein ACXVWZ_04360 [Nocardioides sp.]